MSGIASLPTFSDGEDTLYVVVETPRGSRAKYKYEPERGLFALHKALALGFAFPFAFGFIPGTRAEDGDPLDVLLVTTLDPPTGCILEARPIGVIEVEQSAPASPPIRNDRLLAVPALEHDDRQPASLDVLTDGELADIENFFIVSGRRDGKDLRILGRRDVEHALELVRRAQQ